MLWARKKCVCVYRRELWNTFCVCVSLCVWVCVRDSVCCQGGCEMKQKKFSVVCDLKRCMSVGFLRRRLTQVWEVWEMDVCYGHSQEHTHARTRHAHKIHIQMSQDVYWIFHCVKCFHFHNIVLNIFFEGWCCQCLKRKKINKIKACQRYSSYRDKDCMIVVHFVGRIHAS